MMAVEAGAVDPWIIQPRERARYEEQFRTLQPINGIVTGDQAKGFLLQSQLPPAVLGQIWGLADTNADGKMDITEFSIACKLINLKLRGFPIPPTLPLQLKAISVQSPSQGIQQQIPVQAIAVVPPQQMVLPVQPVIAGPPLVPVQPVVSSQPMLPPQPSMAARHSIAGIQGVPVGIPPQALLARQSLTGNTLIQSQTSVPVLVTQPNMTMMTAQGGPPPVVPPQPMLQQQRQSLTGLEGPIVLTGQPVMTSRASLTGNTLVQQPQMINQVPGQAPVYTTQSVVPGPVLSYGVAPPVQQPVEPVNLPRMPSLESPSSALGSPLVEWSVPHQSKLKYTQLFNTNDRTRTGFLSGPQARNIMMQSRLPHSVLAQIWTLADTDADGRLSCEEFVLALHLCDLAKEGRPLPVTLTPDLVPPTMRRKRADSLSQVDDKQDPSFALLNNVTFEDKRKENYDKGQAELDRRRAALLEAQRKEQEERERKEREEQEKIERMRAEQEARRQQELQKQLQRQREIEQEQEDQRKRMQEQREAARKELERQRQQEWERARTQEFESQRMREQDNVLRLKARNQSLAIELSTLTDKVKELSAKISETRTGVSSVKATIDGMRQTRDTNMSEMAALKSKLKEQNQRLLTLTQEKARLEARNKVGAAADAAASEQVRLAFTNKQITIKHLTEKLADLQSEVEGKNSDMENNSSQLNELKTKLKNLVNDCETVYETYADRRDKILQLKSAAGGGWGAPAVDSWGTTAPAVDSWGSTPAVPTDNDVGYNKYRAIYEFQSRNPDELSFQPGDVIMVPTNQVAEPGWLAGELRGATGWFPESYVEPMDQSADVFDDVAADVGTILAKQQLEGILEVPEGTVDNKTSQDNLSEVYVSIYPYQSAESGDLSFEQGEQIVVIKKEGDWWTGTINERCGIFPSNYVQKTDDQVPAPVQAQVDDTVGADDVFSQEVAATTAAAVPSLDTGGAQLAQEPVRSPLPGSTTVSGRATPADFDYTKPATPDFSSIPAAQTKAGKKGEIATVIAPYQATSSEQLSLTRGQLVCIRKKTTTGWWEGELQAKGKKKQVGWFPASYVKVMASRRLSQTTPDFEAEQLPEKVVAMFPYKAVNEDELTFEKDDVITVVAREEAAWWRGELNGATGLFPSNYVMPVDNP